MMWFATTSLVCIYQIYVCHYITVTSPERSRSRLLKNFWFALEWSENEIQLHYSFCAVRQLGKYFSFPFLPTPSSPYLLFFPFLLSFSSSPSSLSSPSSPFSFSFLFSLLFFPFTPSSPILQTLSYYSLILLPKF